MINIKEDKTYLVTGGSGFLGIALVKYILEQKGKVRVLARDEGKLIELKQKFPSVEIYPGDISDQCTVRESIKDITGIFHLAASKHVLLAEKFVKENIKTNIIGSMNLLELSLTEPLEFILGISTDKAAQVNGVYGATKFIMERMFKQYESINDKCKYRIVRYGNVLYSTGSVLCKWKNEIEKGGEVIITEPEATRFFWSVDQAIDLIDSCMKYAIDSSPYCPTMKSIMIRDLLAAMVEKYGQGKKVTMRFIGLQPGENLHEKVMEQGPYSNQVEMFSIKEIMKMI